MISGPPPGHSRRRSTSALLTPQLKKKRPKFNVRWSSGNLHHVKIYPKRHESLNPLLYYTAEEMKMFRFEKFMEDHADEFEIVEDDEEYEEEEYEEEEYEEEV